MTGIRHLGRFPADSETAMRILVALGAAVLTFDVFYFVGTFGQLRSAPPGDFFGFWSWGHFAADHRLADMYDASAIHAAQVELGASDHIHAPYPYPPFFAAALIPFGLLPRFWSFILWVSVTLVAYTCAVGMGARRGEILLLGLAVPTTVIAVATGQNGLLTAALAIGAFRLAGSRPLIAGMLLGILAFKPQMGILVPFALAAAGLWTVAAAACATVAAEVLAVGVLSGWDAWTTWFSSGVTFTADPRLLPLTHIMPTVMATLLAFGVPRDAAMLGQAASAAAMACLTWVVFRRGNGTLQACTLFLGTLLATPYAFVYDMAASGFAAVSFLQYLRSRNEMTGPAEIAAIAMAGCIPPMLGYVDLPTPLGLLAVAPLLWFVSRRALSSGTP